MSLQRGADASSLVDWAALKATHGITFGFARCQRQYGQKDVTFDENIRRMHDAELVAGGYEFALPMDVLPDPAERARTSWQWFSGASPNPVDLYCLDLERSPVGQELTNAWAKAWFDEWTRIADRPPGLYLGSGYLTNRTGVGLRQHGFNWLWFPRYGTRTVLSEWPEAFTPTIVGDTTWADSAWGQPPDFWQVVDDETLHVDGDVFNGSLIQLRRLNQS